MRSDVVDLDICVISGLQCIYNIAETPTNKWRSLFLAEQYYREINFICSTVRLHKKFKHGVKKSFFAQVNTSIWGKNELVQWFSNYVPWNFLKFLKITNLYWCLKVMFHSELYDKPNNLNSSLQGPSENIITATSKLRSYDKKLTLWKTKVSKEIFDSFSTLNESPLKKETVPEIMNSLSGVQLSLQNYFPEYAVMNLDGLWTLDSSSIWNQRMKSFYQRRAQITALRNDLFFQALFP